MSSIIPFLDESETLFSQEDVIRARTMVRRLINELSIENILFVVLSDHGEPKQFDISFRITSDEGRAHHKDSRASPEVGASNESA